MSVTEFQARIERFHREIEAKRLPKSFMDPAAYRQLRALGLRIPPPLFQPLWVNTVFVFLHTGIPLGALILVWPVFYPAVPQAALYLFGIIAAVASGALALVLALAWRFHRARLDLPDWSHYGSG